MLGVRAFVAFARLFFRRRRRNLNEHHANLHVSCNRGSSRNLLAGGLFEPARARTPRKDEYQTTAFSRTKQSDLIVLLSSHSLAGLVKGWALGWDMGNPARRDPADAASTGLLYLHSLHFS
jgi:hypothetical protein